LSTVLKEKFFISARFVQKRRFLGIFDGFVLGCFHNYAGFHFFSFKIR